jgi:hypothetical protein
VYIRHFQSEYASKPNPNATLSGDEYEFFRQAFENQILPPLKELKISEGRTNNIIKINRLLIPTYGSLEHELKALDSDIAFAAEAEYFYHYPQDKASMILNASIDWRATISAFPSAEEDIRAAVDCYALGHSTASVFHSMRIAELGLRAFAWSQKIKGIPQGKSLKPIEWANWLDIIRALEDKQKALRQTPAGHKKDADQAFFNGALADLNAFKDEYRNMVSHVRVTYDELQALRALERVKHFMNRIASRIDERGKRVKP